MKNAYLWKYLYYVHVHLMRVYSILRKCALVILLNAKLSKFVCPSFIAVALCDKEELERREKLVSLIIKISFDKCISILKN